MLFYTLIILVALFSIFLLFSYWQEVKYRRKPYYKLSDVGWKTTSPPTDAEKLYSVAMVGDVGALQTDGNDPVMHMLEQWQQENPQNGSVIFLGDNVYPVGLPPENTLHYNSAKAKLDYLITSIQKYNTPAIFLSGNHDWNKGRNNGYQQMLRQEKYITAALDDMSYLPQNGCLGPVTIQLAENLLLLVINTQWWVQRGEKPIGKEPNCAYDNPEQFYTELKQILDKNRHQRILVAAHHPLYSNALHGGKFTVKQHLFPLTAANKRFLIPLPILGSLYPFYRKYFGAYEDMSHRKYKKMRKRLLGIFHQYSNLVYVAGHDHNLQHFEIKENHYIVSGSGSKTNFVKKGGKATFTLESLGFFVFNYYQNGELWMETHATERSGAVQENALVFRKKLDSVLIPKSEVQETVL